MKRIAAALVLAAAAVFGGAGGGHADPVRVVPAKQAGGGARIDFVWPRAVPYDARRDGRTVTLTFGRTVEGDVAQAAAQLSDFVGSVSLGPDGRTVTVTLIRDAEVFDYPTGSRVVLEMLPLGPPDAAPDAPAPEAAAAAPDPAPAAETAAASDSAPAGAPAVGVRTGRHTDKTRLVFDWTDRVPYRLNSDGGVHTLTFDAPARIDAGRFSGGQVREIGDARATASEDETQVVFTTSPSSDVRHFYSGSKVVVDVMRPGDGRPPPPLPAPPSTQTAAAPEPASEPAPEPAPEPATATAEVDIQPEPEPAPAPEQAAAAPPPEPDLQPAPDAAPAEPVAEAPAPALPGAEAAPRDDAEDAAEDAVDSVAQADEGAPTSLTPAPLQSAENADAVAVAQQAAGALQALAEGGDEGVARRLRFPWTSPVGAAVFRRAGALWVVFDAQRPVDVAGVMRDGGELVSNVRQLGVPGATVLRIDTPVGINPDIQREGFDWILELKRQPAAVLATIGVDAQPDSPLGSRLLLPVAEPAKAVAFTDPEVGDTLVAVPIASLGQGVARAYTYPQLRIRPSLQGVAIEPRADGIRIRPLRQAVEISFAGDGAFSISSSDQEERGPVERPLSRILDLEPWGQTSLADFEDRRRALLRAVADAPDGEKEDRRRDLAHFYVANRFAAEALGVLSLMRENRPEVEDTPVFRMLRGIARSTLGRTQEALADFEHPSVQGNDEAVFWAGVARSPLAEPLPDGALQGLRGRHRIPDPYPQRLGLPLKLLALDATIDVGDIRTAEGIVADLTNQAPPGDPNAEGEEGEGGDDPVAAPASRLEAAQAAVGKGGDEDEDESADAEDGDADAEGEEDAALNEEAETEPIVLTSDQQARLALLEGKLQDVIGDLDAAIGLWEEAEAGTHRPTRARAARLRVETLLKIGAMSPADAIEQYEALRFAWRGDDFEFSLLRRLGDLYIEENRFREGLSTLRQAATHFRDRAEAEDVTERMAAVFQSLYLDGRADVLPPVTAIAIYDEFKELTPAGERGDELIRRLADRLVGVDLLADAAALLEGQVDFRLEGVEKARVGARLALVRIMNRDYEAALETLGTTADDAAPPELQTQRRHLRARALIGLDQTTAALALLEEDTGVEANLLRTEVHWDAGDWNEAAKALRDLAKAYGAKPREPLTQRQARTILDLATAFTLSGNERALGKLRVDYGPQMADGPYAEAFALIASPTDFNLIDRDRIPQTVRTAANFQTFLNNYRERLAMEPLSAIN
jgi:hypothetical protein